MDCERNGRGDAPALNYRRCSLFRVWFFFACSSRPTLSKVAFAAQSATVLGDNLGRAVPTRLADDNGRRVVAHGD